MKKTIALLALIAMLMSIIGIPVSAAATPQAEPMAAASLDEALNVEGGWLTFDTFTDEESGYYAWVVEDGYAKAGNTGKDGAGTAYGYTASDVTAYDVQVGPEQAISFRVKVSSEQDKDCLEFYIDGAYAPEKTWSGQMEDWETCVIPLTEGKHFLSWSYVKNETISEGEDTAYLDDVQIIDYVPYTLVNDEALDQALNTGAGETLTFFTPEAVAEGYYPWTAEGGYARSTNQGFDGKAIETEYSKAILETTVTAGRGDVLQFRYKVSAMKNRTWLDLFVDGEQAGRWIGDPETQDWALCTVDLAAGEHTLRWVFEKNYAYSIAGEDSACLDDVYVGAKIAAAGVDLQETAIVAENRRVQLSWNVLPDTAYERDVTFQSSDEEIAEVDENGLVTGISQGTAAITVTTKDGSFTDTCTVTVTLAQPPVTIYGFAASILTNAEGYYKLENTWCSFNDVYTDELDRIGVMPSGSGLKTPAQVASATLAGDTIYGYMENNVFFTMNFNALKAGTISAKYNTDVNVANDYNFSAGDMAYDATTDTLYVINNGLNRLCEVDIETGDVDYQNAPDIRDKAGEEGLDPTLPIVGFAIDPEGNAFLMIAGDSDVFSLCKKSYLAKLDLETGEFEVVGETPYDCYDRQAMCFDPNTGRLYWAQYDFKDQSTDVRQLFIVDTETAELTDCGVIGQFGAYLHSMFIPVCGHKHGVEKVEAVAATCTAPGNVECWQCKDCGKCFADAGQTEAIDPVIPALGHNFVQQGKREPTCTEDGYTGDMVCEHCGMLQSAGEPIPALGHDFSVKGETVPPTCIEDGYTVYHCSRCAETEHRDIVPATGEHSYGQWQVTKAATCTEKGEQTRTCTVCHETQSEEIPPLGHTLTHVEAKAATCTEAGSAEYWHCQTCGKNFSDETAESILEDVTLPALGHDFSVKGETVAPTETEDGYTVYHCSRCAETEHRDIVPATGHQCASEAFSDLHADQWYHPYTDYVLDNGLMIGVGGGRFSPSGTVTRAMVVTTLYRLAGSPEVSEGPAFTDVPAGQWYTDAVAWAQDVGIAQGVTETAFRPNGFVTREQAATFLYRYVTAYLTAEAAEGADLSVYKDADRISGYANEALAWATAEGLFEGFENGTLQPKGNLTRAQMAKLLTVLDERF